MKICQKRIDITPMVSTYCMRELGHEGPCEDPTLGVILYRCGVVFKAEVKGTMMTLICGLPEGHVEKKHKAVYEHRCESKGPRGQQCGFPRGHTGRHQHSEADRVHWD